MAGLSLDPIQDRAFGDVEFSGKCSGSSARTVALDDGGHHVGADARQDFVVLSDQSTGRDDWAGSVSPGLSGDDRGNTNESHPERGGDRFEGFTPSAAVADLFSYRGGYFFSRSATTEFSEGVQDVGLVSDSFQVADRVVVFDSVLVVDYVPDRNRSVEGFPHEAVDTFQGRVPVHRKTNVFVAVAAGGQFHDVTSLCVSVGVVTSNAAEVRYGVVVFVTGDGAPLFVHDGNLYIQEG